MAAKLVEDRYIVLFPCHVIREQEPKHKEPEAKQHKKINTNKNNPHKTQKTTQPRSSDVTGTSWGEKDLLGARGDSLVSTRRMQMTTYVSC